MDPVLRVVEGRGSGDAGSEPRHRGMPQELDPLRVAPLALGAQVDDELVALESIPGAAAPAFAILAPPRRNLLVVVLVRDVRLLLRIGAEFGAAVGERVDSQVRCACAPAAAAIGADERPAPLDALECARQLAGGEDVAAVEVQFRDDVPGKPGIEPADLDAGKPSLVDVELEDSRRAQASFQPCERVAAAAQVADDPIERAPQTLPEDAGTDVAVLGASEEVARRQRGGALRRLRGANVAAAALDLPGRGNFEEPVEDVLAAELGKAAQADGADAKILRQLEVQGGTVVEGKRDAREQAGALETSEERHRFVAGERSGGPSSDQLPDIVLGKRLQTGDADGDGIAEVAKGVRPERRRQRLVAGDDAHAPGLLFSRLAPSGSRACEEQQGGADGQESGARCRERGTHRCLPRCASPALRAPARAIAQGRAIARVASGRAMSL